MKKIAFVLLSAFMLSVTGCSPGHSSMAMVHIPGGTFTMGSPADEPDRHEDEMQHTVTLSSFSLGKYPVTQKEYVEIMGINPCEEQGDNLPVVVVNWHDAIEYCNKRSKKEGLTPVYTINGESVKWNRKANGYRLPTEAEWEYACRAGTTTPFSTGDNITTSQANYDGSEPYNHNDQGEYRECTTPVGRFEPNPWGLYDMHGNVFEWCWDLYGNYPREATTDPDGAEKGPIHVVRGGAYLSTGQSLRSAFRLIAYPLYKFTILGFRVARNT